MKLRNKKTGETITVKDEGGIALLKLIENSLPNGLSLWEEVKEPLIKDEKIRKAVRAWAEACGVARVFFDEYHNAFRNIDDRATMTVSFARDVDEDTLPFKDSKTYTIAELCGEEEE